MSYSTGIVYKIVCTQDSEIVYIGSTFNLLRQRWQEHKRKYKSYLEGEGRCVTIFPYFTKYGIENFKILKIKEYKCCRNDIRDAKHLHVFEQLWINKTKGCINKNSAFRIAKLYNKEYNKNNIEKKKEHYQNNKQRIKERIKEHYQNNKQRISERKKEYRKNNSERISEREKEYQKNNKERISEREKEYRKNNSERINERRNQLKEKVECEICKSHISKGSLHGHKKSKKHILAMEKQE